MILVGYDDDKKAYRLLDKDRWWNKRIEFSRDVICDENVRDVVSFDTQENKKPDPVHKSESESDGDGETEEEKEKPVVTTSPVPVNRKKKNYRHPIKRDSWSSPKDIMDQGREITYAC